MCLFYAMGDLLASMFAHQKSDLGPMILQMQTAVNCHVGTGS